jgi:predicted dehydrogenase
MKRIPRRKFLKTLTAGGIVMGAPSLALRGASTGRAASPNGEIRVAIIGLGATGLGVGGRGQQIITAFRAVSGTRIAALCDVDQAILGRGVDKFKEWREPVAAYTDLRRVFDDKTIDAVVIVTPNHWHALAAVWACQAGKDVYVEKPFAYNIWEGRQMISAARKYQRIMQVGTQRRSSAVLQQVVDYVRSGALGAVRCAHAVVYRPRDPIGKVEAPTPIPPTIDYDLWCGPAAVQPLMRKELHYDWHWIWSTGNGDLGNNGVHQIDIARWVLGQEQFPSRAISIGGRFGSRDDGETANAQIAYLDYRPAPLICEIRNFRGAKGGNAMGKFRGVAGGTVIDCETGYVAGDFPGSAAFDKQGNKIKDIVCEKTTKDTTSQETYGSLDLLHATNFVEAVRSRSRATQKAEAQVGHVSTACCHMANVSYRLGKQLPPEAIRETIRDNSDLSDAFGRCRNYLGENGIDLRATPATLGSWVTLDAASERFVGPFADEANQLSHRAYREGFSVPEIA